MSTSTPDSSSRFAVVCPHCHARATVPREWLGREIRCERCATLFQPPSAAGNERQTASTMSRGSGRRFSFSCPRCGSMLESDTGMTGERGRCPTCAAQFEIPRFNARFGTYSNVRLLDDDRQNPVPMHAYAASGNSAPKIVREPDGSSQIVCPRCNTHCDVSLDNCPSCGVPFTIEGMPSAGPGVPSGRLALAALVMGIASLPLFMLALPALAAVGLGLGSWFRSGRERPTPAAIAGALCGVVSLGGMILRHVMR